MIKIKEDGNYKEGIIEIQLQIIMSKHLLKLINFGIFKKLIFFF